MPEDGASAVPGAGGGRELLAPGRLGAGAGVTGSSAVLVPGQGVWPRESGGGRAVPSAFVAVAGGHCAELCGVAVGCTMHDGLPFQEL